MIRDSKNLGVPVPTFHNLVVRANHNISKEERHRVQKATEYNAFAYPSAMLVCDYLSDSGTSAMTDVQWASIIRGDEAYGRNHGYYGLLDAVRDVFERGDNPKNLVSKIISDEDNLTWFPSEEQLNNPSEGGFANGGVHQLSRPNFFLTPQGRCAEGLLFWAIQQVLASKKRMVIPSNGFFDTTEAQAHVNQIVPVNLFSQEMGKNFNVDDLWKKNPFAGNINLKQLIETIELEGAENIPLILLTITNNTGAGQPVSMENIKECSKIAQKYDIPLFFDAARFAENAMFIKEFEEGFNNKTIPSIIQEMFSYVDGFTISLKKDGLANIGGFLCFRDKGIFQRKFSTDSQDIGVLIKERQILNYGNDSYGGLSGRDIMAATIGLHTIIKEPYLKRRVAQTRMFAEKLARNEVPVVLPSGGHAVYIDMTKFFEGTNMRIDDFGGVGFVIELIRLFGIRACELGPFAFEWDKKTPEERKGILNLVRFAIPRNMYNEEHINYTVAAITELYKNRHLIPKVEIIRGKELHLRHFQSGLKPIYPD